MVGRKGVHEPFVELSASARSLLVYVHDPELMLTHEADNAGDAGLKQSFNDFVGFRDIAGKNVLDEFIVVDVRCDSLYRYR